MIGLPANIFFGTGIPTIILVLKQKRQNTDVLMVDASKHFIKVGKNNKLRASDIKRLTDTVINREAAPKYAKVVSRDDIRNNEYNLNIPRYVDSSANAESWDIYASMFGGIPKKEVQELDHYWQVFAGLHDDLFTETSSDYVALNAGDVKKAISNHADVKAFISTFTAAFGDFGAFLKQELLTDMDKVKLSRQEAVLSKELFSRLEPIHLIDKYEAYQLLSDSWADIEIDLEVLQTEGFAVSKQVDPYMVTKKVKGKEQEVQEGWVGHIISFELVQKYHLREAFQALRQKENRLVEIGSEYESMLESLGEEEKEAETVKESGDGFVNAAVVKEAKLLRAEVKQSGAFAEESYEAKILAVDKLITEEKALKKAVKDEAEKLHLLTKTTIEGLSDEQVLELLELSWIKPLLTAINKLPETVINELTSQVQALADKYAVTYADVSREIGQTEKALSSLIDELTGNEFDMAGLGEFQSFLKDV